MFSSSPSTGHPVFDTTAAKISSAAGETVNADAGKHHRVKKKKKKNKHNKHKHKHRHERHERDRGRDSKERFSVSGVASPMVPSVQSVTSVTSMSSIDNARDSAPSSPEFEVIWKSCCGIMVSKWMELFKLISASAIVKFYLAKHRKGWIDPEVHQRWFEVSWIGVLECKLWISNLNFGLS